MTYEPTGWWLLNGDDEYWLYTAEEIGHITCANGYRMKAYPVGKPYVICDKSEYECGLEDLEKARWYLDREIERVEGQ